MNRAEMWVGQPVRYITGKPNYRTNRVGMVAEMCVGGTRMHRVQRYLWKSPGVWTATNTVDLVASNSIRSQVPDATFGVTQRPTPKAAREIQQNILNSIVQAEREKELSEAMVDSVRDEIILMIREGQTLLNSMAPKFVGGKPVSFGNCCARYLIEREQGSEILRNLGFDETQIRLSVQDGGKIQVRMPMVEVRADVFISLIIPLVKAELRRMYE